MEGPPVETLMAFKTRMEGLYGAVTPPPVTAPAGIVVPTMPQVCTQTAMAFSDLDMLIDDLEDILTYEAWLNRQVTESCEGLSTGFLADMNTKTVDLNA